MTLLEVCEPIFQYVCRLNRLARSSASGDYAVVRAEVKALLEDAMQKASRDPLQAAQMSKVELPLLFFIDSMIAESQLKFAGQWHQERLAYERNELAGDEKFFDLLAETMEDNSENASERLAIFYMCVGLGFGGMYAGQPEYLRKTMMTIAPRIRHLIQSDPTARMCPESYEGVDTRDLVQSPGGRVFLVGLIFIICTVSVLTAYIWMFRRASDTLSTSLDEVVRQEAVAAASAGTELGN